MKADLTTKEQANVRAALQFLRSRCGGWEPLSKAIGFKDVTLRAAARGGNVSASVAFRVARLASVAVDDVLAGRFPEPGTCPHCGQKTDNAPAVLALAPR
jgi:hypothetical protein